MNTTNVVTNADGTFEIYISSDHIAAVPLLWIAAVVVALAIGAGWLVAKYRKNQSK
jgi:hypothetical protein